jgi:DNA-binding MarR family transcriptional regulator
METKNTASLLLGVGRVIRARMERDLPISFAQCETLRLLEEKKGLTMRALATHFKVAAPSATALVNELVRSKLVTRTENANDRREVLLSTTVHGKAMLRKAAGKRKKIVSDIFSVLSARDRKELDTILNKVLIATLPPKKLR